MFDISKKLKGNYSIIILSLITTLGFVVRLIGIDFGLPQVLHPDEPSLVDRAYKMISTGDLNPHFFIYPSLLIYINCLFFKIEELLLDEVTRTTMYLTSRIFGATLGTILIPLTYLLGKKLYNRRTGLIASVFIAFMPLAVQHSHYATVDIPLTFFILLSFMSMLYLIKNGTIKSYVLSGFLVGMAASIKYPGGLLVLPLSVAFIIRFYRYDKDASEFATGLKKLFFACFISIVTFLAANPFSLLDYERFLHDFFYISGHVRGTHGVVFKDSPPAYVYHIQSSLNSGMTPFLEVISIVGILCIILKVVVPGDKEELFSGLMLLSWVIPYYLVIGSWGNLFIRYVIPLLPFLAVSAAYTIDKASILSFNILKNKGIISNQFFPDIIATISVILLIVSPVQATMQKDFEFLKKDTRELALNWIDQNIPDGSIIYREKYTPEVELLGKYFYLSLKDEEKNITENLKSDYLVISSFEYYRYYENPKYSQKEIEYYESIKRNFQLFKEFKPNGTVRGPFIKIYSNVRNNKVDLCLSTGLVGNGSNFHSSKGLYKIYNDTVWLRYGLNNWILWKYELTGNEKYLIITTKNSEKGFGLTVTPEIKSTSKRTLTWMLDNRKIKKLTSLKGEWRETEIPLPDSLNGVHWIRIFADYGGEYEQSGGDVLIIESIKFR